MFMILAVNEVLESCKIFLKRVSVTLRGEESPQEILGKLILAFASRWPEVPSLQKLHKDLGVFWGHWRLWYGIACYTQ